MKTRILSFILGVLLMMQGLNASQILAASYFPSVDDYVVYDSGNTQLSRIDLGDSCRLEITMTDNGVKTSEIGRSDYISVQSVSGCLGSPSLSKCEILSSGSDALSYKLTFDKASYTGSGKNFAFKVSYKNLSYTSSVINLKINECSETGGSEDVVTQTDSDGNQTVTITAPEVEIQRESMSAVKAGETFTVNLNIKNFGATTLVKPAVTISTAGDIYLAENTSTIYIADIKAGGKITVPLKFKAEDKLVKSTEEFTVSVRYNYNSGSNGITSNTETAVISVPTVLTKTASAPAIQISRGDVSAVNADTAFVVPVAVTNVGGTAALHAVLNVTTDDELKLTDENVNFNVGDIKPNETKTVELHLKTDKLITSDYQKIECELKYNYKIDDETSSNTESSKLSIPVIANSHDGASPLVQITRSNIETPIAANRYFGFSITVKNVGMVDLQNSVLTLEGSDGVSPVDSAIDIGTLKSGESKTLNVKCRTLSELTSANQTVNAELKYDYLSGKSYQQGDSSVKVLIPVVKTKEETMKTAVPNLIIDSFDYGNQSVANGEKFNLKLNFKNTSKTTPVSNVVVTIEPGEALAISSAANTYYYDSLGALQTQGQSIEMQALPTAESGSAKANVTFKYEYIDGTQRSEATTTQSVSIPIYKPDRMEMTPQSTDERATVGEEYVLAIDYVNKGKGTLSNMRAELVGDIDSTQTVQNLGNVESGKSGTIKFIVTPSEVGETPVSIKVTYEDANLQEKERVFNFKINADEEADSYDDYMSDLEDEDQDESSSAKWYIIGGIAAAAVVAAVIIIKRKKRKSKDKSVEINWED